MDSERELLELAAKAAGDIPNAVIGAAPGYYWCGDTCRAQWNPVTDDGDALRLAVKLGLSVTFGANYVICGEEQIPTVNNAGDPYAATRLAIVRAAAAIGRASDGGA